MSFLFSQRSKQVTKIVWIFFAGIIILSMTLVFSGGSQGAFGGGGRPAQESDTRRAPRAPESSENQVVIPQTDTSAESGASGDAGVETNTDAGSGAKESETSFEFKP